MRPTNIPAALALVVVLGAGLFAEFQNRKVYEQGMRADVLAAASIIRAKLEGKKIEAPRKPKREKVVDLMAALRESAGMGKKNAPVRSSARSSVQRKANPEPARRKAT